ncbi:MAG: hypothetical protein QM664_13870 [Flavihumibacter sp.]
MQAPYPHWRLAVKWLHYYLTASNGRGHGVHSPFVYRFIRELLMDKSPDPAFEKIESLRRQLKHDQTLLTVDDFGAGSAHDNGRQRSIASLAKRAAKSPRGWRSCFSGRCVISNRLP